MTDIRHGAVIAISSHVMRGTVGNRAIVFALETLEFNTWSVPTIVLPFHPGHGRSTRLEFNEKAFEAALLELAESRWCGEVQAILTGFLANAQQAKSIAHLVTLLRAQNPELVYLCDPVIGDEGGLYVAKETAHAIRTHLLPLATISTPNRFELSWLTNTEICDNTAAIAAALSLGPEEVVVTSAYSMLKDGAAALYVDEKRALLAEHPRVIAPPNGLGDLFSALFLAARLNGSPVAEALENTTASVYEVLARAVREGADELMLEKETQSLRSPFAKIEMRQLMHPTRRRKRR